MQKVKVNPKKSKVNVNKKGRFNSKPVPKIFNGKDVFIVGGGASLKDFNFNLLKDKCVIAINRSFTKIPFAQVLYFSDYRFYMWATGELKGDEKLVTEFKTFKGQIYTIASKISEPNINIIQNTGKTGFDTISGRVKHGGNSGYAAINLAYHFGAKRIILMGYDMGFTNKQSHFHDGYISKQSETIYKRFIEPFKQLYDITKQLNIKIYNTNLKSNLPYFEKVKIESFL